MIMSMIATSNGKKRSQESLDPMKKADSLQIGFNDGDLNKIVNPHS